MVREALHNAEPRNQPSARRAGNAASLLLAAFGASASSVPPAAASPPWTRQSANPTHENLVSVALATATHGFAVGASGALLETSDAGATWTDRSPGTGGGALNHVSFLDATHGWIVGNSAASGPATSFRTVDGGSTWIPMSPPAGSWYFASFVNPSFGWMTGNGGTAITSNGGQDWSPLLVAGAAFWATDFTSDGQVGLGRALANGLYRSGNGGGSWTLVLPDVTGATARFLSPTVAVAATDQGIYRSINAGQTWSLASPPPLPFSLNVERLSDSAAIAWNVQGNTLFTSNAGASWQPVDSIGGPSLWDGIYTLKATGTSSAVAVTTLGKAIRTGNGGATWRTVSPAGPTSGYPTMALASNGSTVLGVGNAGIVQRSVDGGGSFALSSSGAGAVVWDLKAWDNQRAIAVCQDGTALITGNAGAQWLPQRPGLLYGAGQMFRGVAVLPAGFACAVGLTGDIVRTGDYGQTWLDISPFSATDFADVDFVTPDLGWVIATYPKNIYRTTNAGSTWQAQLAQTGAGWAYASIDFVDSLRGWATGPNTSIFRTVDGGVTWSSIAIPNPYPDQATPTDIRFVDAGTGWLVGEYGLIMKSTNGGLGWTVQRFNASEPTLSKVSPVSASEAYVSSYGGSVLHTTDGGTTWQAITTGLEGTQFPAVTAVAHAPLAGGGMRIWASGDRGLILGRADVLPTLPGDVNGDGRVNGADLAAILGNWSVPPGSAGCGGQVPCPADINGDGRVDGQDLAAVLGNWSP